MNAVGFLKQALPWIGSAAVAGTTGNFAPLLGMAAKAVSGAVGKDVKPEIDSMAAAVAGATPDQMAALQKADHDFQAQMAQMNFQHLEDLEKIAADDRASARNREITAHDSWTPRLIAAIVVIGWLCVQSFLLAHVVSADMRDIVSRLLGTLDAALMLVLSYYFGSSAPRPETTQNPK